MPKPTLAFIDHSFHKQTHSSDFLRELFQETFDVQEYWDESWCGGPIVPTEEINKHDYAFYLQVMSPLSELKKIKIPITWAPMYDGMKFNYPYWKMVSRFDIKILAFSKKVAEWTSAFAIPTFLVQYYYINPEKIPRVEGNHLFFWYRGGVTFDDLRAIIPPEQVDTFTIVTRPDPKTEALRLAPEDITRYKITAIDEGFLPKERYLGLLKNASIFIAPRKKEGIGAFTEALALGKCVIAYDDATHNEYITHGVDGLLFNEKSGPLDLSNTDALGQAALKRAFEKHSQWLTDRDRIALLIREPYRAPRAIIPLAFWKMLNSCLALLSKTRARVRNLLRRIV